MIRENRVDEMGKEFSTNLAFPTQFNSCVQISSEFTKGILRCVCEVEETVFVFFFCVQIEQSSAHADHRLLIYKQEKCLARTD